MTAPQHPSGTATLTQTAASSAARPAVYLTNGGSAINRAESSGSASTRVLSGGKSLAAVALNGARIYWVDQTTGTIARANLNGTDINERLITGASHPTGIALEGSYIYWTNRATGAIARANLNGSRIRASSRARPAPAGSQSASNPKLRWVSFDGAGTYPFRTRSG
jgi:hypothetical protein